MPELTTFRSDGLIALTLLTCTVTLLLLLLTNSLPDNTRTGFRIAMLCFAGASVLMLLESRANLILACGTALLLLLLAVPAWKKPQLPEQIAAVSMLWVLIPQVSSLADSPTRRAETWLLCAGLSLICFVLLTVTRRLRTAFSDTVFPLSAAV